MGSYTSFFASDFQEKTICTQKDIDIGVNTNEPVQFVAEETMWQRKEKLN